MNIYNDKENDFVDMRSILNSNQFEIFDKDRNHVHYDFSIKLYCLLYMNKKVIKIKSFWSHYLSKSRTEISNFMQAKKSQTKLFPF